MCKFFSLNSDGKGKIYYFDYGMRKWILTGRVKYESTDSHTSIADYFGFKGEAEDRLNKWEYNPLTQTLMADRINTTNDEILVKEAIKKLDFSKIVPQLIIKPIVHPFKLIPPTIEDKHIALLKAWTSARDSVGELVWDSVRDSVEALIGTSVWVSVRASVRASVGESVWDSVRDSAWAYIGSFFNLPDWKYCEKAKCNGYPFQSAVDLWEMGLVPSFDGEVWRLHGHEDGRVLWEGSVKEEEEENHG